MQYVYLTVSIVAFIAALWYGWYFAWRRPLYRETLDKSGNRVSVNQAWNILDWLIVIVLLFIAAYFARGWIGHIELHPNWVWTAVLLFLLGLVLIALALRGFLAKLLVALGAMCIAAAVIVALVHIRPPVATDSASLSSNAVGTTTPSPTATATTTATASTTATLTSVVSSTAVAQSTQVVKTTQTVQSTQVVTKTSSILPTSFTVVQDGSKVTFQVVRPSKDVVYTWNINGSQKKGTSVVYTLQPGTYQVKLVATNKNGVFQGASEPVKVVGNSTTANAAAFRAPLGDPGPGNCAPAAQELKVIRKDRPNGMDFLPPYDKAELAALTQWETDWLKANTSKACVQTLAGFFGQDVDKLSSYYKTKLKLSVVGAKGLDVQNSYYNADGNIVWWRVEHLPPGELVWLDAKGAAVDKFVCLNVLRQPPATPPPAKPKPAVPTPTHTPTLVETTVNVPQPPAPSTPTSAPSTPSATPTPAPTPPVCQTPSYVDNTYDKVGVCRWQKKPQTWDCQQNPDPAHGCPPNPQHQDPTSAGNTVQATATRSNPGVTAAPPTPTTPKIAPTTGNSNGYVSTSKATSSSRAPQTGDVSATASAGGGMPVHPGG